MRAPGRSSHAAPCLRAGGRDAGRRCRRCWRTAAGSARSGAAMRRGRCAALRGSCRRSQGALVVELRSRAARLSRRRRIFRARPHAARGLRLLGIARRRRISAMARHAPGRRRFPLRHASPRLRARTTTATRSCGSRAKACTRSRSGPVHAGIIEPGHFRFSIVGETVLRLEERLGYKHKGIEKRFEGDDARGRRAARRPRLGRQHRRLRLGLRDGAREACRRRAAAARAVAARAAARARAHRQPPRRPRLPRQRRRPRVRPRAVLAPEGGLAAHQRGGCSATAT